MTQFTDRFNEHSLHAELKALDESIKSAELELSDGEVRDGYDRFLRAVEHVKWSLEQVDPEFVTPQALDPIQKHVQHLKEHHDAFKASMDINALNNQTDVLLNQLRLLPRIASGDSDFSSALEEFRRRANEIVDALGEREKESKARIDKLKERIDGFHDSIVQQENRFESQKGRIDELVTNQQAKFNEEQQQRNAQFNEVQKTRETSFDEFTDEARQELDQLIEEKTNAADEQRQQAETRAADQMEALQAHLDHAEKIVGLIGNTGMTGHYQKVANRELWRAEIFRIGAVLFFVLMVVGVGWVVKEIKSEDFNWQVALFRVGVALTLLAPAIYCARESTRHRRSENRNRRIELELASINPYLEDLPEDKAQAVIEKLADRYFGNEFVDEDEQQGTKLSRMRPDELMSIVERVAKMLRP